VQSRQSVGPLLVTISKVLLHKHEPSSPTGSQTQLSGDKHKQAVLAPFGPLLSVILVQSTHRPLITALVVGLQVQVCVVVFNCQVAGH
jgi:hypothetical protein